MRRFVAGTLAAGLATAVIVWTTRSERNIPILLVGLDGADWDVIRPMIRAGRLPNLHNLSEEGASGDLLSEPPLLSPILWTTIATGKPPTQHGITSFVVDRKGTEGGALPVQSTERKCRALWNISSERGKRVCVIGWWATYPAERVRGHLVSDFVGFHNFSVTGRGIESSMGKVYPPDLWPRVESAMRLPDDGGYDEVRDLVHLGREDFEREIAESGSGPPSVLKQLLQMAATSRGYAKLAQSIRPPGIPDLTMIYLNVTDWAGHLFARFAPPRLPSVSEGGHERYGRTFEEAYVLADRILGELVGAWGRGSRVLVLSDHGFAVGGERPDEGDAVQPGHAHEWHRPEGILVLHGPGILPGKALRGASIYDVAPTILHLLDLSVPSDMPGKVLLDAFTPEELASRTVRRIPTYEAPPSVTDHAGRGEEADDATGEEMLRNLKAMGYLGDGTSLPPRALLSRSEMNRKAGSLPEAVEDLERALARDPADPEIRTRLAALMEERGSLDAARGQWEAASRMRPKDAGIRLDLARILVQQRRPEDALVHLREAQELEPDSVPVRLALGDALRRTGDLSAAEEIFRSLTESHPSDAEPWYNLGVCLGKRGAVAEAERAYERCLELDPSNLPAGNNLANLLLSSGRVDHAIDLYRRHVEREPSSFEARYNLGTALLRANAFSEASRHLEAAARLRPDDRSAQLNLGLADLRDGRPQEALTVFLRMTRQFPGDVAAATTAARMMSLAGNEAGARDVIARTAETNRAGLVALGDQEGRFGEILAGVLAAEPKNRTGADAPRPESIPSGGQR